MGNDSEPERSQAAGGGMSISVEADAGIAAAVTSEEPVQPQQPPRRWWKRRARRTHQPPLPGPAPARTLSPSIAEDDPLLPLLQSGKGPVDIDDLPDISPAVRQMRADGVKIVVPMVTSGQLVGLLALGERRSESGYTRDDRALLETLARHAAPALRVGQLVRQQEAEARHLQRIESELAVATLIQQHFLPSELPAMQGWLVDAYYRPARSVGGDFYDVVALPDGRIMVVAGDVTDKGVPAALVMASTQALLRAAAVPGATPGEVLRSVNDLLHPQIPTHMFVTCLALVFDPASGVASFANAGHNLPYLRRGGTVQQLMARGMPLGLLPGSTYEEHQTVIEPGDIVVLYSDGITEQHNPAGEMFDFARMADVVARAESGAGLVDDCINGLTLFSDGGEQEDDITVVAITRPRTSSSTETRFSVPSVVGNERQAMDRVLEAVGEALPPERLDALGTAVSEAAMNAIEHGNAEAGDVPVEIAVTITWDAVAVAVTDFGGGRGDDPVEVPDLDLKLAGLQGTRGWGLFLIERLVDEVRDSTGPGGRHTLTLTMLRSREGAR